MTWWAGALYLASLFGAWRLATWLERRRAADEAWMRELDARIEDDKVTF